MGALKIWIIAGGVVSAITIFLSLLLTSMHVVEVNFFGLQYYTLRNFMTNDIYPSGRHWSGIGTDFIQYPTTNVIFDFSDDSDADYSTLAAWTNDGQPVYIQLSFFVSFINQTGIQDFYFSFGENWKGFFVRMAYSEIKQVTTTFNALDFYQQRQTINDEITAALQVLFLNQSGGILNVTEVQMREIDIDPELEAAVEAKLVQQQAQQQWVIQQNITLILKQIDLIDQWAQNNITLIYANATAFATNVTTTAEANATSLEYTGYAAAYQNMSTYVNMADNNALISFMFAESISKFTNQTNLNIGFTSPGVLI